MHSELRVPLSSQPQELHGFLRLYGRRFDFITVKHSPITQPWWMCRSAWFCESLGHATCVCVCCPRACAAHVEAKTDSKWQHEQLFWSILCLRGKVWKGNRCIHRTPASTFLFWRWRATSETNTQMYWWGGRWFVLCNVGHCLMLVGTKLALNCVVCVGLICSCGVCAVDIQCHILHKASTSFEQHSALVGTWKGPLLSCGTITCDRCTQVVDLSCQVHPKVLLTFWIPRWLWGARCSALWWWGNDPWARQENQVKEEEASRRKCDHKENCTEGKEDKWGIGHDLGGGPETRDHKGVKCEWVLAAADHMKCELFWKPGWFPVLFSYSSLYECWHVGILQQCQTVRHSAMTTIPKRIHEMRLAMFYFLSGYGSPFLGCARVSLLLQCWGATHLWPWLLIAPAQGILFAMFSVHVHP